MAQSVAAAPVRHHLHMPASWRHAASFGGLRHEKAGHPRGSNAPSRWTSIMARGGREGAAPKDEKGGPQFPTQRHRRASSQELRYLDAYFLRFTHHAQYMLLSTHLPLVLKPPKRFARSPAPMEPVRDAPSQPRHAHRAVVQPRRVVDVQPAAEGGGVEDEHQ